MCDEKMLQDNLEDSPARGRPFLETKNLILRPFDVSDAPVMQVLVNEKEIAANTRSIEYPYPEGAALQWIEKHPELWENGKAAVFAMCSKSELDQHQEPALIGAIGLEICKDNHHAELGYWIGKAYWNRGFCTEAARAVVEFGLQDLELHRIHAHFMTRNPASGRVMEKIGMKHEGLLRHHVRKSGVFEDISFYGILKSDLETQKTQ